jgi:hypothetical protein
MIDSVWPGDVPGRRAVLGSWFDLPLKPLKPERCHFVVGDGSFSTIRYEDYPKLAKSVAKALMPGGVFSIRIFKRPEKPEPLDHIWRDLTEKKIESFYIFKWRLAMALQGDDVAAGIAMGKVWDTFADHYPSLEALSEWTGWPLEHIETIDNYRNVAGTYNFPTIHEVIAAVTSAGLTFVEAWRGPYAFSERCPHLVFRKGSKPLDPLAA